MKNNYLLMTPCKNEEDSLLGLIESVLGQTIKPILWVIVNDGSTDKSRLIMTPFLKKYPWIRVLDLPGGTRDSFYRYSEVCKSGFDFVIDVAKQENIVYSYIGLVDADIVLENNVYEKLIDSFCENNKIGLVSGGIYYKDKNGITLEKNKEIFGTPRLWKKQCFIDSGGYLLVNTPDVVSSIKCILSGWDIKQVIDAVAIQTRPTFSANGLFKGWIGNGRSQYTIGFNPLHALIKSIKLLFSSPFYKGLAYFYGYFSSYVKRVKRINDIDVLNYNSRIRFRNEWRNFLLRFK